jgi:hypothetical protein
MGVFKEPVSELLIDPACASIKSVQNRCRANPAVGKKILLRSAVVSDG